MSSQDSTGATREDWIHLELLSVGGEHLLPIPRSDAKPSAYSRVKQFGKTPGEYLPDGTACGIKGWTTLQTTAEQRDRWSKDPRYSVCVRTGMFGAFDIDDPDLAFKARRIIAKHVPPGLPIRGRSNALKFLAAFELPSGDYRKRRIVTKHGAIELLARGQQFVAAGWHSSGVRYEWEGGLPYILPKLTADQLEAIWSDFKQFATSPQNDQRQRPVAGAVSDILTTITAPQLSELKSALSYPPLLEAAGDESVCSEIGLALRSLGRAVGEPLWLEFTEKAADPSEQPDPNWAREWWSKHESTEIRSDFRHVFRLASDLGWRSSRRSQVSGIDAFANPETAKHGVTLIRGSDIKPEPIEWLWNGWLARAKMQIAAGLPGTSKTTIALSFAAMITSGGTWPDGTRAPIGNVLIWSGEDDPRDTLLPRFLAMGGDRGRLFFVSNVNTADGEWRSFDPSRDIPELIRAAKAIGDVALVIIDPIVSAIPGDSHKNAETRRGLQPVVDLADELNATVLGISHYTKGTQGNNPIERVTGSIAFGAVARIIFGVAKMQETDDRIFVRAKSNIGRDGGGYKYQVQQLPVPGHPEITEGASTVEWGESRSGSAHVLLKEAESEADLTKLEQAVDLIPGLIGERGGKMAAKELKATLKTNNIGENASANAIRQLLDGGRLKRTKPDGPHGEWVYELPADSTGFGLVTATVIPQAATTASTPVDPNADLTGDAAGIS